VKLPALSRPEPVDPGQVRAGLAGWSYPDWEGIVYPPGAPRGFDRLEWVARFADVVEINSTFYRAPRRRDAAGWASRVAAHTRFRFCAKLERVFTHEPGLGTTDSERRFKEGIAPLADSGLLYALLVQYPYSFHNTGENRRRLARTLTRFGEYRLAVELRHRSWITSDILAFLSARGVALAGIDQPQVGQPVPASLPLTAPFFYVRLHGRNAADWFRPGAGRDARYDYLYEPAELAPWIKRIREAALSESAAEGVVIANNHFRGQAAANAVEIRSALSGRKVPAPAELMAAYPRLSDSATPLPAPGGTSGRLF
jgi:uncharacterized protein YecE (DUF72 family)